MKFIKSMFSLFPLLIVGCASWVTSGSVAEWHTLTKPVFEQVAVSGLVYRDMRLAGSAQANSYGFGISSGMANYGNQSMRGNQLSQGVIMSNGVAYEAFENYAYQDALKRLLEDSKITLKVAPDAPVLIEGIITQTRPSTGIGRFSWDVLNTISLLFFFGGPYLGTWDASVQLRLYQNHELIGTYDGTGRAKWIAIYTAIGGTQALAEKWAWGVALRDAVGHLAGNPPHQ